MKGRAEEIAVKVLEKENRRQHDTKWSERVEKRKRKTGNNIACHYDNTLLAVRINVLCTPLYFIY